MLGTAAFLFEEPHQLSILRLRLNHHQLQLLDQPYQQAILFFFNQKQCSTTIEKNTNADLIFYQLNLATCCTLLEILISVQVPKHVKERGTWQKNCNYFITLIDEAETLFWNQ